MNKRRWLPRYETLVMVFLLAQFRDFVSVSLAQSYVCILIYSAVFQAQEKYEKEINQKNHASDVQSLTLAKEQVCI